MIEEENLPLRNSKVFVIKVRLKNSLLLHTLHNIMVWLREKIEPIMGLVRSMLKEKNLPVELWGEAVSTCVYVLNRSSTKRIKGKTPYEKWNGIKLNVSHLKVSESVVFVKTAERLSKLEDRRKCMVFMGYEARSKAYICLDPVTFKIHISKDVIFVETKLFNFGE